MKTQRSSFNFFPIRYNHEVWVSTLVITAAFIALEYVGHSLHDDGHAIEQLASSILHRLAPIHVWDMVNRIGYLFYFSPFLLPSMQIENGVLRRVLIGFLLQVVVGTILLLSVSAQIFSSDVLPCLHVANVVFVSQTLFRIGKPWWMVAGPVIAGGIALSAILTQRHDWSEIVIAVVLGYGAYRFAFYSGLEFLERSDPVLNIEHTFRHLWNRLTQYGIEFPRRIASKMSLFLCDITIRVNMETLFLRRRDPWKYNVSQYERDRFRAMGKAIRSYRFEHTLEVGTGEGLFSTRLASISDRLTCLDVSQTALSRTRKVLEDLKRKSQDVPLAELNFIQGNMRTWQPHGERFDLVVLGDVLYYLEPPRKLGRVFGKQALTSLPEAFAHIFRWVKPGGRLLLCHCFGRESELERLRRYRSLFVSLGARSVYEEIGDPSDKGPTRFFLNLLEKTSESFIRRVK